jgi:hypothetical protein
MVSFRMNSTRIIDAELLFSSKLRLPVYPDGFGLLHLLPIPVKQQESDANAFRLMKSTGR